MLFWLDKFGWILLVAYIFSAIAYPKYHFDYFDRWPRSKTLTNWWINKGYPMWGFIAVRFILVSLLVFIVFRGLTGLYD